VNTVFSASLGQRAALKQSELPDQTWSPLEVLADDSPSLVRWRTVALHRRTIPSYVLIGPRGGGIPIRLGLMGGLDSGDTISIAAVVKILVELDLAPWLAQDYALFGYPFANPPGRADERDFENDFWRQSGDPVIHFFEQELSNNELDGVIAVRGNEPISGLQVCVSSRVIATEVLWPALELAQKLVPLSSEPIQLLPGSDRARHAFYNLESVRPHPFSIVIRTPAHLPFENQVSAITFSVKRILHDYRALVGHAESI
jgi:hypothetical protein